ncbi:hypothetical protein NL108_015619, partial [Boleophthalmus pectinirostris]
GIRVTLDNNSMWNEFHRCSTEMIVTKQGGRMFPYCRFRLSGLSPHKKYSLLMDLRPADAHRYRWGGRGWQVCGRAQSPVPTPPFAHPDSPASGQHWMQSPVSFYRLKLTSDADDRSGNAVLHLNQRYLPHLHVVQTDRAKDVKLSGPGVVTFTFPQTEFMAVSLYHNNRLTQLKVQYNPFSKGLKDEAAAKGLKQNPTEPGPGQNPLKKSLKSLLANHKPKSSKPTEPKGEPKGEPRETPKTSADQPRSSSTDRPKSCSRDQPKSRDQSECNLSQYEVHNISSERTPQNSAKDSEKEGTKGQNCTKNAEKPRKDCFVSGKDDARTEVCKENKPVASTASKSEPSSEAKVQKRPPTLPLSALGRFLKQHSAKSKKAKVETDHAKEADNAKTVKDRMVQTNSQLESRKTETKLEPSLSESKDVTDPLTAAERKEPKTDLPVENAQSLPFPGDLSPLALQFPVSPTFSSLDGDALSPTDLTELVHFFAGADADLGIGEEFSNAAAEEQTPQLTEERADQVRTDQVRLELTPRAQRRRKRRRGAAKVELEPELDPSYSVMKPSLEEVEEQLFVSFTSKEALELHIGDSPENSQTDPAPSQQIFEFEQILLRDVKLMKHKQVIHPELQQVFFSFSTVGLKMSLLDPSLPVDLQYLGIPLPLPPPGTNQEPRGATGAFVSRTGKTTDVTQIKGWRDKYDSALPPEGETETLPPEAPPVPEPKKNLSAFCSDMLDEYLETEGKLIDERASSFTAPDPAPSLASYVRTLTCTVKANAAADISTSDIISGFVPPSKRPKPPPNRAAKKTFKHKRKLGRRDENAKVTTKEEEQSKAPPSETDRKPTNQSQSAHDTANQRQEEAESRRANQSRPLVTKALVKQRDLEQRGFWEGKQRTYITRERATVALSSLFTLK